MRKNEAFIIRKVDKNQHLELSAIVVHQERKLIPSFISNTYILTDVLLKKAIVENLVVQ